MASEVHTSEGSIRSGSPKRIPSLQHIWTQAAGGSRGTIESVLKRAQSVLTEASLFSEPRSVNWSLDKWDEEEEEETGTSTESPRTDVTAATGTFVSPKHSYVGCRGNLASIIMNPHFDLIMGIVIVSNIIAMVFETDQNAPCADSSDKSSCENKTMLLLNNAFLVVYTLEVGARIFVLHCKIFLSLWNMLDLFIVFSGFLDLALASQDTHSTPGPSVSLLRIFRVFRLLRALRIFQKIPELHSMMRGFLSAMQAMLWGFVMIIVLLLLFAVLCVEIIHPTLVAGDSWGQCTLPIIKEEWWTFPIFAAAVITVQLGFLNLVLAVIVERATRAKEDDENEARAEKIKMEQKATRRLGKVFKTIDADGSGSISLDELMQGFDTNEDMQIMFSKLDISRSDIGVIFELMDTDNEGELSYDALIQNLRMSQMDDTRKSLAMLRLQSAEIARCCKKVHADLQRPPDFASPRSASDAKNQCVVGVSPGAAATTANSPYVSENALPYASGGSSFKTEARGKTHSGPNYCGPGPGVPKICDVDAAMAALRASLDKDFADIRNSIAKLVESVVPVACRDDPSCQKTQDGPSWQKQDLQATSESQVLWTVPRAGPQCSKHSTADLRIVDLLREVALHVELGPRAGEVSL